MVNRQFKKHIIKAADITNPLEVFMYDGKPCHVVCANTIGWKRHQVRVECSTPLHLMPVYTHKYFYAWIKFFDNTVQKVDLACTPNDYYFCTGSGWPTLWRMPDNWLDSQQAELNARRSKLEADTKRFNEVSQLINQLHEVK